MPRVVQAFAVSLGGGSDAGRLSVVCSLGHFGRCRAPFHGNELLLGSTAIAETT